ncbi:cell division protein FtsZ [Polaribacter pacificus]|uniref:Cell division protein FtsZ n=1 Tax=Polaribacter pacificus TaxID=1775173 RepID=A0A917MDA8_9FLAO|nr:cell division protein FtsZ [Polaribacter pacificus]GGG95669.1 cell division protein FtsZ [Polaribacter pacificus]
MSEEFDSISFDMPKSQSNAIKVIGVGGGGSNAVNHMFQQDIRGVDFVICNTDAQALENSPVPNKIQLGADLTSGLGAGANPEIGEKAAEESIKEIQQMLSTQTKMVFITAGMGGGTGTGAAPIIAKIAKDMDILTVGIVTMPFQFEGRMRSKQAQIGIDTLRDNVDSLIVINNNKLREVYGNLGFKAGFSKADEVLSTAARGIAEVITHHYKQNIDLHDAKTVLSNSGTAIMGSAKEDGKTRAKNAIIKALDSPLLNDNKITGAKNVLLLIVSGVNEVTLDEIGEINDHIQIEAGYDANIIMGIGEDDSLGDAISVTVVATGFAADQQGAITNTEVRKIIHTLEDEQKATYDFSETSVQKSSLLDEPISSLPTKEKIVHVLEEEVEEPREPLVATTAAIENIDVVFEEISVDTVSEDDFIITDAIPQVENTPEIKEEEPVQLQADLLFDLPLNSYEEIKAEPKEIKRFDLSIDDVNDIEVHDAIEIVAKKTEVVEKRYVLEDFDSQPTIGKSSTPKQTKELVLEEEEMNFEVKTKEVPNVNEIETISDEISPLSLTISELEKTAEMRKQKMKGFNYKFSDQVHKNIDEIERQPAYKRLGVDLDEVNSDLSKSRTTLSTDASDEVQLRSNNSFLHDNVD